MTDRQAAQGHRGDNLIAVVHELAGAVIAAPSDPGSYLPLAELWRQRPAELAQAVEDGGSLRSQVAQTYLCFLDGEVGDAVLGLGSLTGAHPEIAWATAPWFGQNLDRVSPEHLAEAALRTMDRRARLNNDEARERLQPWFHAIEVVSARSPDPESLARMALLLRACGRTEAALALCDRADATARVALTEVVRAGTWRALGDLGQTAAAFERALALEPENWSLYLDLADVRALQEDFAAAAGLAEQGLAHGPEEIGLRAARAAYGARLTGSAEDLEELLELADELPDFDYQRHLLTVACAGPGLPADLIAEVHDHLG